MSARSTGRNLSIDGDRLLARIGDLAAIGDTGDGGARRMALTDTDRAGRDQLVAWMRDAGLTVGIDAIGNIFGRLEGAEPDAPPVMTGSHIDTVATGGRYDGVLGVLAGLEAVTTMRAQGFVPRRPIVVAAFTNEEGARFQPDMMGSSVHVGALSLADARAARDGEGLAVGAELDRIGYAGDDAARPGVPHAFVELHIEQGPILALEGVAVGALEAVQGIVWLEATIRGEANHAGTTPLALRKDAGLAAARLMVASRAIAEAIPGQLATHGVIGFSPGNINVVPGEVSVTIDLRNPDDARLAEAERRLRSEIAAIDAALGTATILKDLARFPSTPFDPRIVAMVEAEAEALGVSHRRMVSGAGHDAQLMARIAPAAMIFVPSIGGISHNPAEATADADVIRGADILLAVLMKLASEPPNESNP